MLRLIQSPSEKRFIDDGRVFCPVRGHDTEFDLCAGCRSLTEIDIDAEPPFVRCRPDLPANWMVRMWL
jgi:hypothetical protein